MTGLSEPLPLPCEKSKFIHTPMTILSTILVLVVIALISAILLFITSKKFEVKEDPRIGEVAEVLPQANCGGCGHPGCASFAKACCEASSLEGL